MKTTKRRFHNRPKMKIKLKDIYWSDRIRTTSGKDLSKLQDSMARLGQLQNIIVKTYNEDGFKWKGLAGFCRSQCGQNLKWEEIEATTKDGLSVLEELDVEIEENVKRNNLYGYELDIALARRKRLYEEAHPKPKGGRPKKTVAESATVKKSIVIKDKIKEPTEGFARFSKATADLLDVSERTVQTHTQIGEALLEKKFDKETVEAYKKREITHAKMLEKDKERRKKEKERAEKRKLGFEAAKLAMVEEKNEILEEIDDVMEAINGVRKELEIDELKFCRDCEQAALQQPCPSCGMKAIECMVEPHDSLIDILYAYDAEACDGFERKQNI